MPSRAVLSRSPRLTLTAVVALGLLLGASSRGLAQDRPERPIATTLRMPADSSTSEYKVAPAFGGLFFDQPVHVVYAPDETQRAFVIERPGRIAVVRDTAAPTREVFLDISTVLARRRLTTA